MLGTNSFCKEDHKSLCSPGITHRPRPLLPWSTWPWCLFKSFLQKICQWKCPSLNENGLALSKMKFPGVIVVRIVSTSILLIFISRPRNRLTTQSQARITKTQVRFPKMGTLLTILDSQMSPGTEGWSESKSESGIEGWIEGVWTEGERRRPKPHAPY